MAKKSKKVEETETKEVVSASYDVTSDRNKLAIIFVVFILLALWVISAKSPNGSRSDFANGNGLPNNNGDTTENTPTNTATFESYMNVLSTMSSKTYDYIYSIETGNEKEYLYLRGSVDGEKESVYKEWQGKDYLYFIKGTTNYIKGNNTWKKTNYKLSYEGYDTVLFNPINVYKLLSSNTKYENKTENGVTKITVTVPLQKLVSLYNDTVSIDSTINDQTEEALAFELNSDEDGIHINVDLKSYYQLVYNKEYNEIFYDLNYDHIGTTSLNGIEDIFNN